MTLVDSLLDGVVSGLGVIDTHNRRECEAMLYRALFDVLGVSALRQTSSLHRLVLSGFEARRMQVCRASMDQLAEFKELACVYVSALWGNGGGRRLPAVTCAHRDGSVSDMYAQGVTVLSLHALTCLTTHPHTQAVGV